MGDGRYARSPRNGAEKFFFFIYDWCHCLSFILMINENYQMKVGCSFSPHSPPPISNTVVISVFSSFLIHMMKLRIDPNREFPGGPVVRISCFHCQGPGLDPWSVNQDPANRVEHTDTQTQTQTHTHTHTHTHTMAQIFLA